MKIMKEMSKRNGDDGNVMKENENNENEIIK